MPCAPAALRTAFSRWACCCGSAGRRGGRGARRVLHAAVNRGSGGGLLSVGFSLIGALAFVVVAGFFNYAPAASALVNGGPLVGIPAHTCAVGYVVYRQNRRLVCTRDNLQASE